MNKLLITGCGRSGTHYTSALLQAMDLDIPHEAVGKDGAASWKHIVSGTFVYIGKNRSVTIDGDGFDRILHQVRHPLKVIASMQTFSDSTWSYMAKAIELDIRANPLMKGMQAYLGWNRLIEQSANWRFRIEDIQRVFPEFCQQAGIQQQPFPKLPKQVCDSRTQRYRSLRFADLLNENEALAIELEHLAAKYGYHDLRSFIPAKQPAVSRWSRLIGL